jgi:hypothetical protein
MIGHVTANQEMYHTHQRMIGMLTVASEVRAGTIRKPLLMKVVWRYDGSHIAIFLYCFGSFEITRIRYTPVATKEFLA